METVQLTLRDKSRNALHLLICRRAKYYHASYMQSMYICIIAKCICSVTCLHACSFSGVKHASPLTWGGVSGADAGVLDSFVLPMMLGSIGELRPLQFQTPDKHYGASISLIARRSTQRIGTRHWRRGADSQACHSSPLLPSLPLSSIYTSLLLILLLLLLLCLLLVTVCCLPMRLLLLLLLLLFTRQTWLKMRDQANRAKTC